MKSKFVPRVLLVGAGHFGRNHLRVLQKLEGEGILKLSGVVVGTFKSKKELAKIIDIPVYVGLSDESLVDVAVVDIVTPAFTHSKLIEKAIKSAHVFVEKPIAFSKDEARRLYKLASRYGKALTAGHIYRFHPLTEYLKNNLKIGNVTSVHGEFISPSETYKGEKASFEELHLFDILDYLIGKEPEVVRSRGSNKLMRVEMRYPHNLGGDLTIGWREKEKIRSLAFTIEGASGKERLTADFVHSRIAVEREGRLIEKIIEMKVEPLEAELREFFLGIADRKKHSKIPQDAVIRVTSVAERASHPMRTPPKIAIIGGGIFGLTAGIVLAEKYKVDIFEREEDILTKASYANQYRHHQGFHYPRSEETIREVQGGKADFEKMYGTVIREDFPSYYAVSNKDSYVSSDHFLKLCRKMGLQGKEEYPTADFLDRTTVSLSVKTTEAIYDFSALKSLIKQKVKSSPKLKLRLGAGVVSADFVESGEKAIKWKTKGGKLMRNNYDVVVNATYADYNLFCDWLGFPPKNLEYRFKEIILVEIESEEKCAVTIVDGPFATLVPTGVDNLYTFGDVPLSVHKSTSTYRKGDFEKWSKSVKTRWEEMRRRCLKWFPILERARYVGSMYVALPIEVSSADDDARPTVITSHGLGCYSVLSGKIITSVSSAKELKSRIARDCGETGGVV